MAGRHPATADLAIRLTGASALPVVEVDRADVLAPRRRIIKPHWPPDPAAIRTTALGHALSELSIREWDICHAVAKTALARGGSTAEEHDYAAGTYLQNRHLVVWNGENLRLRPGGILSRTDAARTALSGRIGEAVLYLFMKDRGYRYWDHIPGLVERAFNKNAVPHAEKVRFTNIVKSSFPDGANAGKRPDFAFEKRDGESALAEAKGGLISNGSAPSTVKGDLSQGLQQLEAWAKRLRPRPKKSFVVGTYLREVDDTHADPSLIAFVDPDSTADSDDMTAEYPKDWIRRGNYGAWLIGMGFSVAGESLRNGEEVRTHPHTLPIVALAGRRYAFTSDSCCMPWPWLIDGPFFHRHIFGPDELHMPIFGIEVDALRAIEKSVNNSSQSLLFDVEEQVSASELPDWFSGSVFPDGSMIGALHVSRRGFRIDDVETFKL